MPAPIHFKRFDVRKLIAAGVLKSEQIMPDAPHQIRAADLQSDRVAAALNIGAGAYDDSYYGPAFAAMDKRGTCDAEGPKIAPLIKKLRSMGGGTDPIG